MMCDNLHWISSQPWCLVRYVSGNKILYIMFYYMKCVLATTHTHTHTITSLEDFSSILGNKCGYVFHVTLLWLCSTRGLEC